MKSHLIKKDGARHAERKKTVEEQADLMKREIKEQKPTETGDMPVIEDLTDTTRKERTLEKGRNEREGFLLRKGVKGSAPPERETKRSQIINRSDDEFRRLQNSAVAFGASETIDFQYSTENLSTGRIIKRSIEGSYKLQPYSRTSNQLKHGSPSVIANLKPDHYLAINTKTKSPEYAITPDKIEFFKKNVDYYAAQEDPKYKAGEHRLSSSYLTIPEDNKTTYADQRRSLLVSGYDKIIHTDRPYLGDPEFKDAVKNSIPIGEPTLLRFRYTVVAQGVHETTLKNVEGTYQVQPFYNKEHYLKNGSPIVTTSLTPTYYAAINKENRKTDYIIKPGGLEFFQNNVHSLAEDKDLDVRSHMKVKHKQAVCELPKEFKVNGWPPSTFLLGTSPPPGYRIIPKKVSSAEKVGGLRINVGVNRHKNVYAISTPTQFEKLKNATLFKRNYIAEYPIWGKKLLFQTYQVHGTSNHTGHNNPGLVAIEYYDPFKDDTAVKVLPFGGGQGPVRFSIITGHPYRETRHAVKIAGINVSGVDFGTG